MRRPPFPAYRGDAPYVFICYAHADDEIVYSEIDWLRHQGFNIWYDEGISGGADWREEIAAAIDRAALFLYFLSPAGAASPDCVREAHYAVDRGLPLVVVEIEPTALEGGLRLSISNVQAIRHHALTQDRYRHELIEAMRRYVRHSIRRIEDQAILMSDVRGFFQLQRTAEPARVERLLICYENLAHSAAHAFDGVVRSLEGDSFLLTFSEADAAVRAAEEIALRWRELLTSGDVQNRIAMSVGYGAFSVFRSFVFGASLNVTSGLLSLAKLLPDDVEIVLSDRLVASLEGDWRHQSMTPSDYFPGDLARTREGAIYEPLLSRVQTYRFRPG